MNTIQYLVTLEVAFNFPTGRWGHRMDWACGQVVSPSGACQGRCCTFGLAIFGIHPLPAVPTTRRAFFCARANLGRGQIP